MTNPILTLEGVSFVLPDGRTLFSDLHATFHRRPTALVGRNGVGKTVLTQILAGQLEPTTGRCVRSGSVRVLAQQGSHPAGASVADLVGARATLDALARIEAGSSLPADFDTVGDRWDIRQHLEQALDRYHLGHLDANTLVSTLSGGEAMRIALIGALLSDAEFLILDEPSNHLDTPNRRALIEQLQGWPRGLLVVSHDRRLLEAMPEIVELSPLGLRSYGGNFSVYTECKAREREAAAQLLEQRKLDRQRKEQSMREQLERQARRQARGGHQGRDANQARILLDRQKERSESSMGKLRKQHADIRAQLVESVCEASRQLEDCAPITLLASPHAGAVQRRVADLEGAELPFVAGAMRHVEWTLLGRQRVGVVGPNGCGKSTLLKILAGQLQPLAGTCRRLVDGAYLDQGLGTLAASRSVLEQMQEASRGLAEGELRMRLSQLGLDADKIVVPSGSLSGGERLKAALAHLLYRDPPPPLLLLDEPSNHLDLPSLQALEVMLNHYRGTLVVVSHDETFMNALGLTNRLRATDSGWRLEPWD